jgi:hypothetical protein
MMAGWIALWKFVFVAGAALFFVMSVWVTVRGWSDVGRMFAAMRPAPPAGPVRRSSRGRPSHR